MQQLPAELKVDTPAVRTPVRRSASIVWPGVTALAVCVFWMLLESRRLAVPAPFEDAAMLFRYAENLANGSGITWNVGQHPGVTDGATDLGFVLALAPLCYLGLSCAAAALVINLAAVFGIGALFGTLNARVWRQPPWVPIAVGALVASGPVNRYVLSGFSPAVMAFFLLAAFTLAACAPLAGSVRHSMLLLAAASVMAGISGWWRPEGFGLEPVVVLFGLLLTWRGRRHQLALLWASIALVAPFALLVVGWCAFRIAYFGHLLPTSAVMKSGALHPQNVVFSMQFYAALLLPLLAILVACLLGPERQRSWWVAAALLGGSLVWINAAIPRYVWSEVGLQFVPVLVDAVTVVVLVPVLIALAVNGIRNRDQSWLLPVALFVVSLAWLAIATTLNWWGRMQWPLVPVLAALAVAHIAAGGGRASTDDRRIPRVVVAGLACLALLPMHLPKGGYFESPFQTVVAAALATVDTSGIRLATTEAGLIPLAVQGSALDTYGHNSRSIAETHGAALAAELEQFAPNMLAVHGLPPDSVALDDCQRPYEDSAGPFSAQWSHMVTDIYRYAGSNGLRLVRISETSACETWSLWLSDGVDAQVREAVERIAMPGTDIEIAQGMATLQK